MLGAVFFVFLVSGPFFEKNTVVIDVETVKNVKTRDRSYLCSISKKKLSIFLGVNHNIIFCSEKECLISLKESKDSFLHECHYFFEDSIGKINNFGFNDPNFDLQFSIKNTGQYNGFEGEDSNVFSAWNKGYSGRNVTLAIVDDGCATNHIEFSGRFNESLNLNVQSGNNDVSPKNYNEMHGTMCLGVAAASSNSHCIIGSAPNATLACHKLETVETTIAHILKSLTASLDEIHIASHSWGIECDILDPNLRCFHFQTHPLIRSTIKTMIETSRRGLGKIIVFAAGNEGNVGFDANSQLFNKDRHFIMVGASTYRGGVTYYSNFGCCVLINAPSGGQSWKVSNIDDHPFIETVYGGSQTECSRVFTGTSASTPLVAGIIAMILEANPLLSWRDVQCILALTSTINDPTHYSWIKNSKGFLYSKYLGFGRIDADLAIQSAKNWKSLPEESFASYQFNYQLIMPKLWESSKFYEFEFSNNFEFIESIVISFYCFNASDISLFEMNLYSPGGTKSDFKTISSYQNRVSDLLQYQFTIRNFFGESTFGKWKIELSSQDYLSPYYLTNFSIEVYGMEKYSPPSFVRKTSIVSSPIMNPNTHLQLNINDHEFYCNESIEFGVTLNSSVLNNPHIRLFLADNNNKIQIPIGGLSPDYDSLELKIPCLYQDYQFFSLQAHTFENNYSAIAEITVHHKTIDAHPRIIYPLPYSIHYSGSNFYVEWESFEKIGYPGWKQRVIVRLYNVSNNKLIFQNSQSYNNGRIDFSIGSSFQCPQCLLTIIPVESKKCSTMVIPLKIISINDLIPLNFSYNLPDHCSSINVPSPTSNYHWFIIMKYSIVVSVISIIACIFFIYLYLRKESSNDMSDSVIKNPII